MTRSSTGWVTAAPTRASASTTWTITHNVGRGRMDSWYDFYGSAFGFRETRFFDIKGRQTGLTSRALTSPDGKIRIPINESADDSSQIEEFLRRYRGEGIQHIALGTDDIYSAVDALHANGLTFMPGPPDTYEMSHERVKGARRAGGTPEEARHLIDGEACSMEETRILLQIFSRTVIGP